MYIYIYIYICIYIYAIVFIHPFFICTFSRKIVDIINIL